MYHDFHGGLALQCDAGGHNPVPIFSNDNYPKRVWPQNHVTGGIYNSFTPNRNIGGLAWDYENGLAWGGSF